MTDPAPAPGADRRRAPAHAAGRGTLRAAAWTLAIQAVFFAPALLGSGQFAYRDNGRLHIPEKRWIAEELKSGHVPEWNPFLGLGAPVVAGAVDAVQHPFNLLLVALPFDLGFKLWVLLSYPLAALGTFTWARRLGRSWHASLAAGLAFSLSGFLVGSSDNVSYLTATAALPWIFASAHAWLDGGGPGRLALVGAASGLTAAAGDPQSWGIALVLLVPYALFVHAGERSERRAALGHGLAAAGTATVGAAPFLLPVLAWMGASSRSEPFNWVEYQRWNFHPIRLVELVVPHLLSGPVGGLYDRVYEAYAGNEWSTIPWVLSVYLGVTVVVLAAAGAAERRARTLLVFAGVLLWMSMGPHAGFGQIAQRLPVLASFRYWEKLAVWPTLFVSLAAAFGIDRVLQRPERARGLSFASAAAAGLLLAAAGVSALAPTGLARALELAPDRADAARELVGNLHDGLVESALTCVALALVALLAARPRTARLGAALLAFVVVLDVGAANLRGYVLSPSVASHARSRFVEFLRDQPGQARIATPFRLASERFPELTQCDASWLWGRFTLSTPWNVEHRISNFEGYAGMLPVRSTRYLRRTGLLKMLPGAGMWGVAWVVVPRDPELAANVNLAPPYHVAAADPALPAYLLSVPHRPRAYVAGELFPASADGALEFVLDGRSTASGRTALEGDVPPGYVPPTGEARIVRDDPERVELAVSSSGRAVLVLNDGIAPGWTATVDGRAEEILPANYLGRAVWVDAGTHRVVFGYRTPLWREGWALAAVGGAFTVAWALVRRRRRPVPGPGAGAA